MRAKRSAAEKFAHRQLTPKKKRKVGSQLSGTGKFIRQ